MSIKKTVWLIIGLSLFATLAAEAGVNRIETAEGIKVTLQVIDNKIVAQSDTGQEFSDAAMLGARIYMNGGANGAGKIIVISGFKAQGVESWVRPGKFYPTYELSYLEQRNGIETRRSVCPAAYWNPTMTLPKTQYGIVFSDQAFDQDGNDITSPASENNWLSIACAGGALAKKTLMGYDLQLPPPHNTSRAENQTILAMITARYCGGTRFTKNGTAVYWQNDRGWFNPPEGLEIEAIWDAKGAVCLNRPRRVSRADVESECGALPRCDDFDVNAYHLTSYLAN